MLLLVFAFPIGQVSAANVPHQVTNVRDRAFSVSWVTDSAETGYVSYGISPGNLNINVYDDRGQATIDDTHHVTITGLNPGTTYYYEIISGDATYDNNGSPYQMTTAPSLGFTLPEMISGSVYRASGAEAEGTIIYISMEASQVLSGLVNSQGAWAMDIAPIRTADYQEYVAYTNDDSIYLDARGGCDGTASTTITMAVAKDGELEITLVGGTRSSLDEGQSDGFTTQSAGIQWWVWLVIGLGTLGIAGFILKKLVFYHD
jgi:hypothetical protein